MDSKYEFYSIQLGRFKLIVSAMKRHVGLVGLLVVAMCATAGPGYLPVVGPPALRFKPPASFVAEPVPLPPLAIVEPQAAVPASDLTETIPSLPAADSTNAPAPTPLDLIVLAPLAGPLAPDATNVTAVVQTEPEVLVPQMFMKYFTGRVGTNSSGVSIYAPVGFVPPLPIAPPSSSATFQTTPPGKP